MRSEGSQGTEGWDGNPRTPKQRGMRVWCRGGPTGEERLWGQATSGLLGPVSNHFPTGSVSLHLMKEDGVGDHQGSPHPGLSFYARREEGLPSPSSFSPQDLEGPEGPRCVLCPALDQKDRMAASLQPRRGTGAWWQPVNPSLAVCLGLRPGLSEPRRLVRHVGLTAGHPVTGMFKEIK